MNKRLEEQKAARKKFCLDSERFWAQTDAQIYSVTVLIDLFLKSTDALLPEDQKLSFFANDCYEHLGWSYTCQVYEHILASHPDEPQFAYHSWTFLGTALMKDAQNVSFEERVRIAADVEAVYERAAQDLGYYRESTMGYFYYGHPLKAEHPQRYLLKSKEWFERAIENDDFSENDHHNLQILGHVFFELGDFETAFNWYKKYSAVENRCGDNCVLDRTLAEKRLAECRQRLC